MMFPAGSRLLIGATVLTALAATLYGVTNGGSLGTMGLISAAVALFVLTAINLYTRDADVSAMDAVALTDSAAAQRAPWASLWPAVGALGGALVVIGLVTYPIVFVFGIVVLVAATAEWMLQAWSERASGDSAYNSEVRQRFAHAAEFPVLGVLAFGVIVYSFSRIMLALSREGGPIAFAGIGAIVLASGFLIALRRNLDNRLVAGVAATAVLALLASGIAAALYGERETHEHETTADLAADDECDQDEREADEDAGQSVADKANVFGEIDLQDDGTLVATQQGVPGETTTMTFQRSNPTNLIFNNESDEPRRLVLEYAERVDNEVVPVVHCTSLVEDGGSGFMTFEIGVPSGASEHPYQFVVPGVEGESIEVVVP
jgi:hypothetical protein